MKVIFFAPHSFLWPHSLPEAHIVHSLRKESIDVLYVTCGGLLNTWCVSMESTGENENMSVEKRKEICLWCNGYKNRINETFKFPTIDLASFFTSQDMERIEEIVSSLSTDNVLDLVVDGYPIGRLSLYNYFLQHKKMALEFSEDELPALRQHISSSLRAFFTGKKILEQYKPDRVLFYSSSYSANLVIRQQAETRGIQCYSLFAGSNWADRLQKMHIARKDSFTHFYERDHLWRAKFQYLNATKASLESVEKFIRIMLSGESVFLYGGKSSNRSSLEIRKQFSIEENSKVVLLASSSYDEVNSAKMIGALPTTPDPIFRDQKEWIKETIDFFRKLPDTVLVIRIHPRELPNQRDGVVSPHYSALMEILEDLPSNVRVNLPKDKVSFNDWLEIVQLGIISWSSAGRDLATWGIPFISYSADYSFYPRDQLGIVPMDKVEYFNSIVEQLKIGWSKEQLIKTYRWLAYEMNDGVFDLSDVINNDLEIKESWLLRQLRRIARKLRLDKYSWHLIKPTKQFKLISDRIVSGKSVEELLETYRARLNDKDELKEIKRILLSVANQRFGLDWQVDKSSNLRIRLSEFLNE